MLSSEVHSSGGQPRQHRDTTALWAPEMVGLTQAAQICCRAWVPHKLESQLQKLTGSIPTAEGETEKQ